MKKALFIIFALLFVLSGFNFALAQEKIEINFFYSKTCFHCAKEKAFLENLKEKYPEIELKELGIFKRENVVSLKEFYERYQVSSKARGYVPITFIGTKYFLGYDNDENTGKQIEDYILSLIEENGTIVSPYGHTRLRLPIIGQVDISKLSPLALAIILGTLDGFNACAMIALGFLLTCLVATGMRRKIILAGGVFIFISGLVYFLFISAWLNLFLVLEQIKLITSLVGVIIIIFSIFLLKDYFQGIVCRLCEVSPNEKSLFARIEKTLLRKMEGISKAEIPLVLFLIGVALIAAGVNLVELICSFGFPLAFTKILADLKLSPFVYYLLLLVYVLFYMIDDFLIFLLAVFTLRITQVSQRYLKVIKLVSGVLLLVLGLIILLRPEFLMFG